jgi:hypothetical protein
MRGDGTQSDDERSIPERRVEVLRRLTERLEKFGVLRFDPRTGEQRPIRVAVAGDEGEPWFAVADEVLVDRADAKRAVEALGDDAVDVEFPRGVDLVQVRFAGADDRGERLLAVLERLRALDPPVRAYPHHILSTAWTAKIFEGDDVELPTHPLATAPRGPGLPGAGVTVAVIDNGIAKEALTESWLRGIRPAPGDIDPLRVYEPRANPGSDALDVGAGHGTFVTGVVRQVAPGTDIRVIRALDSDGVGTDIEVAQGIQRAVAEGAAILNLSFGGYTYKDEPPAAIDQAIGAVPGPVVIVAAAGNESTDRPVWPGALRRIVSVAATTQRGDDDHGKVVADLADYTNRGWWVDTAAPGTWVSTFVTGDENPAAEDDGHPEHFERPEAEAAGTSFAAAAISGALAAELSMGGGDAHQALRRLLRRPKNVRLSWGGIAVDIWND